MSVEETPAEGAPKEELAAELKERVREYETLFGTTGNAGSATKRLKERGLSGGLKDTKLRSVVWKVLLEVLPPYVEVREWPDRIQATRKEYEALCDKYCIDPHKLEESSGVFDPLSQDENVSLTTHPQSHHAQTASHAHTARCERNRARGTSTSRTRS